MVRSVSSDQGLAYLRKPVASTALRTCLAVNGLSKAPSGEIPLRLFFAIRPITEACRASTVRIESAAPTVAGVVMLSAWPE